MKYFLIFCLLGWQGTLFAGEWTGYLANEWRYFPHSIPTTQAYEGFNTSFATQLEYYHQWDQGYQTLTFVPFFRWDQHDDERTHIDIRELTWLKAKTEWELRLGIRKLFWGVTESQHLVDIINQTDSVENPDEEDKLGQPMLNLALIQSWGTVDLFVLPFFRERTFPSLNGRLLNGSLPIGSAHYESGAEDKHVDWAIRWSHFIDNWDIGISHFAGTSRAPHFIFDQQNQQLIPYYAQITQTGLDLQMTQADMLWKLEWISQDTPFEGRFTALTGGLEYTFIGIGDSDADLGTLVEYSFDDRQKKSPSPFENDLMLGLRLTLNDVQSSVLLAGIVVDMESQARFFNLEASRRLGDNWKLSFEARSYTGLPVTDPLYGFRQEDYWQLELAWYF